jgi:hypothetical protein
MRTHVQKSSHLYLLSDVREKTRKTRFLPSGGPNGRRHQKMNYYKKFLQKVYNNFVQITYGLRSPVEKLLSRLKNGKFSHI